jgi:pimeloyl-ACP methyl ester carboxylesterase
MARHCRVLGFSLCGDPGAGASIDPALGFDSFVAQVERVMDGAGIARATVCGVSFGGLIAVRFAAVRPERTAGLILVSAPSPRWQPDGRVARYVKHPRLSLPLFVAGSVRRLAPEIVAAHDSWPARLRFAAGHALRVLRAPSSPARMSERVRLRAGTNPLADCARVAAPTLVVTGEAGLDRVVPVAGTLDYLSAIRNARHVTIERTGHIGLVSRADRFAEVVGRFVKEIEEAA